METKLGGTEKRMSQVRVQVNELDSVLDSLGEVIRTLRDRLVDVVVDVGVKSPPEVSQPEEQLVPLAGELRTIKQRTEKTKEIAEFILHNLEL